MKAGWILKSKGRWSVTEQGLKAYKGFKDPEKFTSEFRRLYRPWAANRPEPSDDIAEEEAEATDVTGTFEEAEESARIDIERHLRSMAPYDFQNLVVALLRAMGYHVSWIAPPGRGCVSIHQMVHGRALSVRVLAHDEAQPRCYRFASAASLFRARISPMIALHDHATVAKCANSESIEQLLPLGRYSSSVICR